MKVSAQNERDMEIFLRFLGEHLGEVATETVIDLYTDFELSTPEAGEAFSELRSAAAEAVRSKSGPLSRLFSKKDKFMGFPLDLSSEAGVKYFSLLAHRTINCESHLGNRIVFSSVENENLVYIDLDEEAIIALVESARRSGAQSVTLMPD